MNQSGINQMRVPVSWVVVAFGLLMVVGVLADQPVTDTPPGQAVLHDVVQQKGLVSANSPLQVGAAGELIGFSGFDGSGSQTITLVHTGKMQIAVYHIDRSGEIRLQSSRPIDADFSLSLNLSEPLPGQIRLLSGQVK